MSRARAAAVLLLVFGGPLACAGILSLDDVGYTAPDGGPDSGDASLADAADATTLPSDASEAATADTGPLCLPDPPSAGTDAGVSQYADCGTEAGVDLLSRDDHCGRCDHACAFGHCNGGYCDRMALAGLPDQESRAVFVEDGYVYWVSGYTLQRAPVGAAAGAGGEVVAVHDVPDGSDPNGDQVLLEAVSSPDRFWIRERGSVASVRRDGGDWQELTAVHAGHIALEPGDLAYTDLNGSRVARSAFDGSVTAFAAEPFVLRTLVRTRTSLYWVTAPDAPEAGGGQVKAAEQGPRLVVDDAGRPLAIATDGEDVYWGDSLTGRIYRLPASAQHGDAPILVAEVPEVPIVTSIAVDATHVYWLAQDVPFASNSVLFRRAKCGKGAVTIVQPLIYSVDTLLAPDGPALFFTADRSIVRVSK